MTGADVGSGSAREGGGGGEDEDKEDIGVGGDGAGEALEGGGRVVPVSDTGLTMLSGGGGGVSGMLLGGISFGMVGVAGLAGVEVEGGGVMIDPDGLSVTGPAAPVGTLGLKVGSPLSMPPSRPAYPRTCGFVSSW